MPLLNPDEYSPEALMADVPLQRAYQDILIMQLTVLQEGLSMPVANPFLRPSAQVAQRYTVGAFETLPIIATKFYGVPDQWQAIANVNGLDYPYTVVPGQVLEIPLING